MDPDKFCFNIEYAIQNFILYTCKIKFKQKMSLIFKVTIEKQILFPG